MALAALLGVLSLGICWLPCCRYCCCAGPPFPHVAFLGRIPGTDRFTDFESPPDNETIPGLLIFRVEASILYFNAEQVENAVIAQIAGQERKLEMVICDLASAPYLDLVAARMLLRIVNARAPVRDLLWAEGLEEKVGQIDRRATVPSAVRGFTGKNALA